LTGIDGAITHFRPRPAEGPLPEMLASLEAEFFVEWQVAEHGPVDTGPPALSAT
jgi:hypothetical protein